MRTTRHTINAENFDKDYLNYHTIKSGKRTFEETERTRDICFIKFPPRKRGRLVVEIHYNVTSGCFLGKKVWNEEVIFEDIFGPDENGLNNVMEWFAALKRLEEKFIKRESKQC